MKAIVEWGHPAPVCVGRPCGVSGQFVVANKKAAALLAVQLWHTMTHGAEPKAGAAFDKLSPQNPRVVVWSADRANWIAISMLDGEPRGAYAALADKHAGSQA